MRDDLTAAQLRRMLDAERMVAGPEGWEAGYDVWRLTGGDYALRCAAPLCWPGEPWLRAHADGRTTRHATAWEAMTGGHPDDEPDLWELRALAESGRRCPDGWTRGGLGYLHEATGAACVRAGDGSWRVLADDGRSASGAWAWDLMASWEVADG